MTVQVDPASPSPVYRQVYDQVKHAIVSGQLGAGRKLPPVRELSSRLHVSHLTVHRAYQLLADDQMIELRHGSGAYVSAIKQREQATEYLKQFLSLGPMVDFEETASRARVDSMATLAPDLRLFDWSSLFSDVHCAIKNDPLLLGFHQQPGDSRLRRTIARWAANYGIEAQEEDVFVRPGGSALAWLTKSQLKPGDHVLVEQPSYLFAADELAKLQIVPVGIPNTRLGPDLEFVRNALRNPATKAILVAPNSGFGTGTTWTKSVRKRFVEVLTANPRLVIENFSFAMLTFAGRPQSLAAEAPHLPILTDFNLEETLAPGLGLAWSIASHGIDLATREVIAAPQSAPLRPLELAMAAKIEQGEFERCLRRAASLYSRKYQLFRTGLVPNLPVDIDVPSPQAGYSLILHSPVPLPPADLFRESLKAHCPVMPGLFLGIKGSCQNIVRVNFGSVDEKRLVNVGQRLGQVITRVYNHTVANPF